MLKVENGENGSADKGWEESVFSWGQEIGGDFHTCGWKIVFPGCESLYQFPDLTYKNDDTFRNIPILEKKTKQNLKPVNKPTKVNKQTDTMDNNVITTNASSKKDKFKNKDCCSGRLKKQEQRSISISNSFDPLDVKESEMVESPPQKTQPHSKIKIVPVLPPND